MTTRPVRAGMALAAAEAEGVLIVDTTGKDPVVVGTIATTKPANGIAIGDKLVAIAEDGGGVLLVDPCPAPEK